MLRDRIRTATTGFGDLASVEGVTSIAYIPGVEFLSSHFGGGFVRLDPVGFFPSSELRGRRDLWAGQSLWGMTSLDSQKKRKRKGRRGLKSALDLQRPRTNKFRILGPRRGLVFCGIRRRASSGWRVINPTPINVPYREPVVLVDYQGVLQNLKAFSFLSFSICKASCCRE